MARFLGVPHIAAGDLVRAEIKSGSLLGQQMQQIVNQGKLLPDEVVVKVLQQRLETGALRGETGFILDGFPRTVPQAEQLSHITSIDLALNLSLREEVLVEKCMGRRMCSHCGSNYNIADIYLPAEGGRPEIIMPPLSPPAECQPHLETRADDTEEVIRKRLQVYHAEATPVEDYYRERGLLLDFEITGGIPETLPVLKQALEPYMRAAATESESDTEQTA